MKTTIYIKINGLKNPDVNSTSVFSCQTDYDGVSLDKTESMDHSLKLEFLKYDPSISIVNFDIYPINEGEIATYSFTMKSKMVLPSGS